MADPKFLRGAKPSKPHKLLAAMPHVVMALPPPQFAAIPSKLSMWGNDKYGDCVSAEEAFAIAAYSVACGLPERFVPESTVIAWASKHGVLNGADLTSVMDARARDSMDDDAGDRNLDGPYTGVDYSDETVLQSAISIGPVKIGIDANGLPNGAGNHQGWYSFGSGHFPNTDHCVSMPGYGQAGWLFQQLKVALPNGVDPTKMCYLIFTWNSIGVVDHPRLMSMCTEAWGRNPTTVGLTPQPTHWDL